MTDQVEGGEAAAEAAPPKVDGRVRRAARTRSLIMEATRDLIVAGVLRPKAGKVLHYQQYVHPQGRESVSFAAAAFYG